MYFRETEVVVYLCIHLAFFHHLYYDLLPYNNGDLKTLRKQYIENLVSTPYL